MLCFLSVRPGTDRPRDWYRFMVRELGTTDQSNCEIANRINLTVGGFKHVSFGLLVHYLNHKYIAWPVQYLFSNIISTNISKIASLELNWGVLSWHDGYSYGPQYWSDQSFSSNSPLRLRCSCVTMTSDPSYLASLLWTPVSTDMDGRSERIPGREKGDGLGGEPTATKGQVKRIADTR